MNTCTKAEYALRQGVSRPAISQAIAAGRVVVLEDGRVDVDASDRAWARNTDAIQSARANASKRRAQAIAEEQHRALSAAVVVDSAAPPVADRGPGVGAGAAGDAGAPLARVIYDFENARAKRETHAANIAEMEERKRLGIKVLLFLLVFTGLMYALKRKIWSDLH